MHARASQWHGSVHGDFAALYTPTGLHLRGSSGAREAGAEIGREEPSAEDYSNVIA